MKILLGQNIISDWFKYYHQLQLCHSIKTIICRGTCSKFPQEAVLDLRKLIVVGLVYTCKSCFLATGQHFNLPGHQLSDMEVTILEKVRNNEQYRKQREQMWIERFNTKYKGLNRKSWLLVAISF